MSNELATRRAWEAFERLTHSPSSHHRADRALTLHMLEGHAPRVFEALGLAPVLHVALRDLRRMEPRFPPGLRWHEVMARLDALYLLRVRGERVPKFDARRLVAAIRRLQRRGLLLHAWLYAALASRLGVEVEVRLPAMFPWKQVDLGTHLAHLTHLVLVGTDYLAAPLPAGLELVLDELQRGAAAALWTRSWDILGEVVFCLQAGGRGLLTEGWLAALAKAQHADGHFEEGGCRSSRERAHTTATGLIALAGAWERQPGGPSGRRLHGLPSTPRGFTRR